MGRTDRDQPGAIVSPLYSSDPVAAQQAIDEAWQRAVAILRAERPAETLAEVRRLRREEGPEWHPPYHFTAGIDTRNILRSHGIHDGLFFGRALDDLWGRLVEAAADARQTIDEINRLDLDAFVARLGFLFEGSPWIAAEAWTARPFASRAELHRRLVEVVVRAPVDRQLALIRAHPDLVGRAALAGTLDRASTAEQAAAGLDPDRLSPEEIATFTALNRAYRERFGFPFVICARENKKESILNGMRARLGNDREREIATALDEIARIAHYRLIDVVADDD